MTGRMTAKVLVAGTIVHVDNRYLAVWVRERGAWRFVAYQPTPIIAGLTDAPKGDGEARAIGRKAKDHGPGSALSGLAGPPQYPARVSCTELSPTRVKNFWRE